MTHEACTAPSQKRGRNSRRAREEKPGEPVLPTGAPVKPVRKQTGPEAPARLPHPCPILFDPAHAMPIPGAGAHAWPRPCPPAPPPRGTPRSHAEAQSSASPDSAPPPLRSVLAAGSVSSALRSRTDVGRGRGAGPARRRRLGAGSEVTWVNTPHVELSLSQEGGASGLEEGGG